MWDSITIGTYQRVFALMQEYKDDPEELEFRIYAACCDKSIEEMEALTLEEYAAIKRKYAFIHDELPGQMQKHVTVNGRRYRFLYDIRHIRAHRYIDAKGFYQRGLVPNLHLIAASFCVPQKRTLFGWKDAEYKVSDHAQYAEDFKQCPVSLLYGSVVFFCNVFALSMINLKDFLVQGVIKQGKTEDLAIKHYNDLCIGMDGLITAYPLPNTKGSNYLKRTNYQ